ncbi:MAG: sensor histidine kinase [Gemmata sp.]
MKRLLGPVGGPVVFVLVAALAFAGLAWATIAALRVEQAQREAAARAELGNSLRVALWRLDGRMLPALGVEDSRPFYHYSSADPVSGTTGAPTPLLAAPLPEWMTLHVQLDPTGWESPQVLAPAARARVQQAWPELPLRNDTAERAAALRGVGAKYPPAWACEVLGARDRAIPADSPPFAVPLFTNDSLQQHLSAPASLPKPPPPPEMTPISGLPGGDDGFRMFGWEFRRPDALASSARDADRGGKKDVPGLQLQPSVNAGAQAANAPPRGGFAQVPDNDRGRSDFWNRAGTIQRAMQESKSAGAEYPFGKSLQQSAVAPGTDKDGKGKEPESDPGKAKRDSEAARSNDPLKSAPAEPPALRAGLDRRRHLDAVREECRKHANAEPRAVLAAAWGIVGAAHAPSRVPPAEDRPAEGLNNRPHEFAADNGLAGPPAVNTHVGSMRPQWLVAADGTETLVLVRAAHVDDRTVYQGVVLDWPALEQVLKDEVRDLFPDARLVPVQTVAGVQPDRAMTALPVQLDPGPAPALPPTGWSTLRLGLLLAWVAAFSAFAAVGLSGWSLIDLAERRIRFVSAVTHELRTPLTSLRLYLDLLTSGMIHDEAKRQEYLATLAVESDRLHRLVDNVLDFAKLEKRGTSGALKPANVGELLAQVRQTWAERVATDGKELVVISTLPPELELRTDPAMVQQIVGNLIDNARKYTRDAADRRIWLWARPDGARVVFEVEDRGPGVPASERKVIFKPFRRGASADTAAGGAGLGLALAKQWAEVLGGTVAYRPADGAPGSCFRLELPSR